MFEAGKEIILPQSLLNEILSCSENIKEAVEKNRSSAKSLKIRLRDKLLEKKLIRRFDIGKNQNVEVTGVDGTYFVDSLLANEVITVASLAVKGLFAKNRANSKEKGQDYISKVFVENPTGFASSLAVSLMSMYEIILASNSESDVVLLDGSFFTPLLNLTNAFNRIPFQKVKETCIFSECEQAYEHFRVIFKGIFEKRFPDKVFCFVTKHVTSKDMAKMLGFNLEINDRALSTLILEENEYFTVPKTKKTGSLKVLRPKTRTLDVYSEVIESVETVFFKPRNDMPALKIDVPAHIYVDREKFEVLLGCLKSQCVGSGILEPYPLYIAHIYCSNIKDACIASREMATLESVKKLGIQDNELFLHFYSFRTIGGD